MIYYNSNIINDWNFGDDNIIKVYHNNAVCYYKVSSTSPTAQTPCYAVVDDITQYQDTEFEDVYDKATEKWYKLNNLNQYEEYGVYGSGRTITTYDGKLTIDTESTPQPSRLPQGYTEVEYIRQNSNYNAYINTGVIIFDNTTNTYTITTKLTSEFHSNLGCATIINCERVNSPYEGLGYRYKCASRVDQLEFFGGNTNYTSSVVDNGDGTKTVTFQSSGNSSFTTDVPLSYFASFSSTTYGTNSTYRYSDATIYSATVVKNGDTVRDLVPAKRNSDDKYGLYDLITDTFYTSPNGNNFIGGSEVIPPPITATCEFMYSGGSWVNLGEVSGSTIIIKSPEYIEKDSSHNGKINLDYVWKTNSKMQFKFYSTSNGGGAMIGEDGMPDNNDCRMFFASTTAYFDWGSSRISWSSNGRKNTLYEYEYGNYYIKNMVTSASKTSSTISTSRTNTLYLGYGGADRFRTYYLKFYDGDTLVKDFIPWTDMNGNYGLFDKVSLSVYNVASGSLTGSSNVTDVEVGGGYEYPLEYPAKQDPPDNVTFTSMTEAESYECPWVGMTGIISNTDYLFCNTYTWLTKYAYEEVSGYLCESGNKYKKLQEYDRQLDGTMSATTTYVKGDLIETHSSDCPQCTVNFCGVDANGNTVTVNNGTSTLTQSNWASQYPVNGEVGTATTTIGMYCFRNISGTLTALTIGNTVTTIEHEAFMETSLITTLTIPSSVTQIDFWAFTRCNGLTEVIFEGTTPPTFTNKNSGVFHDYCPPVIYVPDEALSAYRAIDGTVWTNQSWSTNIIQPISNR